ncbi:MAG: NAD(P)-binding domain-containing protein [Albidovulum sp.]|nr:NAD(P)-binding domain-containing protein [Albidovulum sp.]
MAILLDIRLPDWNAEADVRRELASRLPGVSIYCGIDEAQADVRMAAVIVLHPGVARKLPRLKLVQKLGAGVEGIVRDPELPSDVRITRFSSSIQAESIASYCVAQVLRAVWEIERYRFAEGNCRWQPGPPRWNAEPVVGVLGLGRIGSVVAKRFSSLGLKVIGWSISKKSIQGIECRNSPESLRGLLGECDCIACVLPSTPETRSLFCSETLSMMKAGSLLINVGRGDLIDEKSLVEALERDRPSEAVLDVLPEEPLPASSMLWNNERVFVTPHVSGWKMDDVVPLIAENYNRLMAGRPLLNEIDRAAGY